MKLPLARVAEFTHAVGEFDRSAVAAGYSIDSRTVQPGDLFFAVKGERLDGHDFVEQALATGAIGAIIGKEHAPRYTVKTGLLVVDDTLSALQALGAAVRRMWGKTVVGLTGSTGKTTTKEAIAHLLATQYRVLKTEGNLNNHFGLPLTLLKLEAAHDIAVIELGMNHAGEITALARIAAHDVGVVTNVAPLHLEFFDSVSAIARAKYELIESLHAGGAAVLNCDDEYVSQFGRDFHGKVVTFGLGATADVRAENIVHRGAEGSVFDIVVGSVRERASLPLVGKHNVYNALAAIAAALERGIKPSEAAAALATLQAQDKRGQLLELGGATVINDCYNANPKAMNAMVDVLASMPAKRRIVVAGEMLELGPTAPELHRRTGAYMAEQKIDVVVGVRGLATEIVAAAKQAGLRAEFLESPEQAGEWLARETRRGDAILLKASRGVKLERALDAWRSRLADAK
jgi:UDP-N-acetylmuramoyl-tripeptide--D-alanyl-D-alanine ligase